MKWPNKKYKIGENHLCRSVFLVTQISQMRPVRSLQIPPESGKCPTDFTDLHRFFLGRFFVTQISQMTQIFFIIGWYGIYSEIFCCGDYSRIFADATCPVVADTPWDWTKRFTRDSIKICVNLWNLWDKTLPRRKICVISEICVTKNNRSIYRARAIGQRPKFRENPWVIRQARMPSDSSVKSDEEKSWWRISVYICEICGTKPSHEEKSARRKTQRRKNKKAYKL